MVHPVDKTMQKSTTANKGLQEQFQLETVPNPFNSNLLVRFDVKQKSSVTVTIYDSKGGLVKRLYDGVAAAGVQQFQMDGSNWSNGTYFCEVVIGKERMMRKLVLQK
jgi:flagellar hook assembly protein FlgD